MTVLAGSSTQTVRAATLFALHYLRDHAAFTYLRRHEPAWLLNAAITRAENGVNLVQTVATFAAPFIAAGRGELALSAPQAAEVVVRTVLSHVLIEGSNLSDEEIADTVARAVTGHPHAAS